MVAVADPALYNSPTIAAVSTIFCFSLLHDLIRPSFCSFSKARILIPLFWDRRRTLILFFCSLLLPFVFPALVTSSHLKSPPSRKRLVAKLLNTWLLFYHKDFSMPPQLLPASAAAFAPRASSVNVVLSSKVEPWLTQTLKRINRVKRPLNSVPQHQRCLTETLSSSTAIWTLTSLMLPKAPDADLRKDSNPLIEALFNYQLIHIEAYIVHVDMVLRNEVAFKLTPDSIESLIEHHKEIHCVDISANTYNWSEKELQVKKLHEEFIQSINKFVYRTHVSALEGLEEDGCGELLCGKSDEVKNNIMGLFLPLLPPPPRIVDVVRPPPLLPSSPAGANWWSQPSLPSSIPAPVDSWRVIPSSPSTTSSADTNSLWASMGLNEIQLPSPTPSFSQPYTTAGLFYSSPQVSAPIPSLPLPSMLAQQQCGVSVGYGGFGWDRYQEYATTM